MYQPFPSGWFALGFVICMALFGVALVQRHRKRWNLGLAPLIALCAFGMLQVVLAMAVGAYNRTRLREELQAVSAAQVQKLVVSRDDRRREVVEQPEIGRVFSFLQSLRNVAPHHSHPVDNFDLVFEFNGHEYHYRIGKDSARADEYWVKPIGRSKSGEEGYEIGRIQSEEFGRVIEELFRAADLQPR